MKKLHFSLAVVLSVLCVGLSETSWGFGFGGFHGGGFHGGGFHGGGMHGGFGGFHGGMPGGFHGGLPGGGMRGGSFGGMHGGFPGGFPGGGGLGGDRGRGGLGGLGGGGLGGRGPGGFGGGGLAGLGGGGLARNRFPGGGAGGFGGRGPGKGGLAGLGEGKGGLGGLGKTPDRNQLGSFLGLPSDGGMNKLSANHTHAGKTQIGRNQLDRNRLGADQVNRDALGKDELGRDQLGRDARGMTRYSNQDLLRRGADVRRDFDGRGYYSADWYRRYPGAWYPRAYAYGDAWTAATWDAIDGWFDYGDEQPDYYDYGNTVTYQDNSVYMNGQDMGTSEQYYDQAQTLADAGKKAQSSDDAQWMPLGVFAMTHGKQNNANLVVQLAVDKQGIIRGNYTAKLTNDTKPIQGSVDKKTQRAAFTIGDDKQNVIETGIYNLTKPEAPILVHFGKAKTEQWLLVRLKDAGKGDGKASGTQQQ